MTSEPTGLRGELLLQRRHQRHRVGIALLRSARARPPGRRAPANPSGPSKGQKSVQVKQRSGFGRAIIIELAARPDVQRARVQREVAVRPPAGSSAPCSRSRGTPARGRSRRAICSRSRTALKAPSAPITTPAARSRAAAVGVLERRARRASRSTSTHALLEADRRRRLPLRRVQQQRVEAGARDGVDGLARRRRRRPGRPGRRRRRASCARASAGRRPAPPRPARPAPARRCPRAERARLIERPRSAPARARVGAALVARVTSMAPAGEDSRPAASRRGPRPTIATSGRASAHGRSRHQRGERVGGAPAVVVGGVQRHRARTRMTSGSRKSAITPCSSRSRARARRRRRATRDATAGSRGARDRAA